MEIALVALIASAAVAGCYVVANTAQPVPVRVRARSDRRTYRR